MELKKYTAQTMAEAMIRIKEELGEDAIIVQTRKIKHGSFLGIGGKTYIEVTAIKDDEKAVREQKTTPRQKTLEEEIAEIKMSIKGVNEKLSEVKMTGLFPEPFEILRVRLIELGMTSSESFSLINDLSKKMTVEDAKDKQKISFALRQEFSDFIKKQKINFSLGQKVIFIGPTGVGKTTTIAKIAAKLSLKEKLPLFILSFDTYRISAAQQMKTYADIMHIPFDVIYTPDQAMEIISSVSNKITLIDTAGRSQFDELKISEIETYVKTIKPDLVFLVIDATKKRMDIEENIKRFSALGVTHIILTKIDETVSIFGPMIAVRTSKPLAFVTNGQNVPGDIICATEFNFEDMMVKEVVDR